MALEVSGMEGNIADLEVVGIKENQIRSLISMGSKINAVEQARLAQRQGIASA